jgi:hypothetical protein
MLSSYLKPSHDAALLLEDMKNHLMMLPFHLKPYYDTVFYGVACPMKQITKSHN